MSSSPLPPSTRRRGAALIIVLAFIVLLTVVVVAFLSNVTAELNVAGAHSSSMASRQLADSAVQLVTGQIVEATRGRVDPADPASTRLAWASQPGMIRTYAGKNPARFFKLYSAQQMTVAGTGFQPAEDLPPADWNAASNVGIYTDLNAPMMIEDAAGRFEQPGNPARRLSAHYPIFDASAAESDPSTGKAWIEGIEIDSPPGYTPTAAQLPSLNNPAPMPVRWLYVLADGQIVLPAGRDGILTIPGATKENPVFGRIAFWTDDETCKVNINTAAEGTFWDTPRFDSVEERKYSLFQPVQREWQRYPGHPAMVALSPIFLPFTPNPTAAQKEQIYTELVPRVVGGGSKAGTRSVPTIKTDGSGGVTPDADRLYASVDELLFKSPTSSAQRTTSSLINPQILERARFFLTAHSRAPEVNLFGLPRISIWPIHADAVRNPTYKWEDYTTPFDRVMAFCSSLKGTSKSGSQRRYYFQRRNADSETEDYKNISRNQELYAYLQGLTAEDIPGFGGNFLSKLGDDRDQVLTEIFDYIRATNPHDDNLGIFGSPSSKAIYSAEPGETAFPQYTNPRRPYNTEFVLRWPGHGQVTPIKIGTTMGFGRFYSVSEASLAFICNADPAADSESAVAATNPHLPTLDYNRDGITNALDKIKAGQRVVQAALLLEAFSPAQGYDMLGGAIKVQITGLDQLKLETPAGIKSLGLTSSQIIRGSSDAAYRSLFHGGRGWGGNAGPRFFLVDTTMRDRFVGSKVLIGEAGQTPPTTMRFIGNDQPTSTPIVLKIYSAPGTSYRSDTIGTSDVLVQTIELKFPSSEFPTPELVLTGTIDRTKAPTNSSDSVPTAKSVWWGWTGEGRLKADYINRDPGDLANQGSASILRIDKAGAVVATDTVRDVVRSLVPAHGDYRLVAASPSVPSTVFVPHHDYHKTEVRMAHALKEAGNENFLGSKIEGTLSGLSLDDSSKTQIADLPNKIPGTASTRGDFDNGPSYIRDGAYINKPDDGSIVTEKWGEAAQPYWRGDENSEALGSSFFSPNRKVPSAVMFGSLPTGLKRGLPWQTLLFRPQTDHPGAATPKDHLLLDLFQMPVVEPYAISEPFSTAGKINLNYQIIPFAYLSRRTAIHALLKSEKMSAVPNTAKNYKSGKVATDTTDYRYPLNLDPASGTLRGFELRFAAGDIFRSGSEICDLPLVPQKAGATYESMADGSFWNDHRLTGENSRERPYAHLLPRLTTKSNTYTVHFRVQVLKNSPTHPDQWIEKRHQILSEFRGSTIIERYIDAEDANLPDFATDTDAQLDMHYQFRVIGTKIFDQ